MASMLEVMREYKHLTAKKRAEGTLAPSLEERLAELEGVVRASRTQSPRSKEAGERAAPRANEPRAGPGELSGVEQLEVSAAPEGGANAVRVRGPGPVSGIRPARESNHPREVPTPPSAERPGGL